jgi:hypothetical protein
MEHCTSKPGDEKEIPEFGPDSIERAMPGVSATLLRSW